jgi:hypothetical protein
LLISKIFHWLSWRAKGTEEQNPEGWRNAYPVSSLFIQLSVYFLRWGSHCVAQAALKLLSSNDLPPSAPQVARTLGTHHNMTGIPPQLSLRL